MHRPADAIKLAAYAEHTLTTITGRIAGIPPAERPRELVTGLGGSINAETNELLAQNVAGGTLGGLARVLIKQVLL